MKKRTNTKKSSIKSINIVSVCFNQSEYIDNFFKSFLQVYGGMPYPILIADNSSQDNSYERLNYWKNIIGENVSLFKNKENIGFAKANNQLISLCKSEIIVLLNLDIQFNTDFIDPCAKKAKLMNALVAPQLSDIDQGHYIHYAPFPDDPFLLIKELFYLYLPYFNIVEVDWLQGACWILPYKIFTEINGFDENYFVYTEDMEFCRNLKDKHTPRLLMNTQKVFHPRTRMSKEKQNIIDQNMIYYFRNRDQSPWNIRNSLRQFFSTL